MNVEATLTVERWRTGAVLRAADADRTLSADRGSDGYLGPSAFSTDWAYEDDVPADEREEEAA